MCEDGQREPGSVAAARLIAGGRERGRGGRTLAGRVLGRRSGPCWYAAARRADCGADEGQLAALREIGREWDRVSADTQVWRQALPVDPSLGEYPEASEVRPALFTCAARILDWRVDLPLLAVGRAL